MMERGLCARCKQGFEILYKQGQALDVYYDPENPVDFFVDTKQSEKVSKALLAIVGVAFCAVGFLQLFS